MVSHSFHEENLDDEQEEDEADNESDYQNEGGEEDAPVDDEHSESRRAY